MAAAPPPPHYQPLLPVERNHLPPHAMTFSVWAAACRAGFWGWVGAPIVPALLWWHGMKVAWGSALSLLYPIGVFQVGSGIVYVVVTPLVIRPIMSLVKNKPGWWRPRYSCACAVGTSMLLLAAVATVMAMRFKMTLADLGSVLLYVGALSLSMGISAGLAASHSYRHQHDSPSYQS